MSLDVVREAQSIATEPAHPRLSIVHVVRSLMTGGQETMLVRLVERLDKTRFACSVLVLQGHDEEDQPLWRRLVAQGFEVKAMRARPSGVAPTLFAKLALEIAARRADVVHAHNLQPLLYAGIAARARRGTVVVATAHGYRNWSGFRFDSALRALLPKTAIVAVAPELASLLEARGFHARVIVNGVDVEAFAPPANRSALRAALGLEPGEWVLGALGRLAPEKDHEMLLRAMRRVARVEPRAHLLVAGDGPSRPLLEARVAEFGLEGRVRLLGERADARAFLGALDVFCLSSRTEGTSLSLLEAMSMGVPVVATRVGGTPSVVDGGRAASLVPASDDEAFARALLDVRADASAATERAARARRIVATRFSLRAMVDAYAALYGELAPRSME